MQMPEGLQSMAAAVTTTVKAGWKGKQTILLGFGVILILLGLSIHVIEVWQMFHGSELHITHNVFALIPEMLGLMILWKDGDVESTINVVGEVVVKVGGVVVRITPWGRRKDDR